MDKKLTIKKLSVRVKQYQHNLSQVEISQLFQSFMAMIKSFEVGQTCL